MSRPWSAPRFAREPSANQCVFQEEEAVEEARRRADYLRHKILQEAQREASLLRMRAKEEGYREGYNDGVGEARCELAELAQDQKVALAGQLEQLMADRETTWNALVYQLSEHLDEIAKCCCLKLLGQVPSNALPREQIVRAIQSISDGNTIQLRVHPKNREGWPSHLELDVVVDTELGERDFLLSGAAGFIDGTWESRWSRMKTILEEPEND